MTLEEFLGLIVAGGSIVGLIVFAIMELIRWPASEPWWFAMLPIALTMAQVKRAASLLLAVGIVWAAFYASVAMGYKPCPEGTKAWIEALFPLAATGVTVIISQAIHGATRLGKQPAPG